MRSRVILLVAFVVLLSTLARGNDVPIGFLSFDVFIPAGSGPGINAFDLFNFTGPSWGPAVGPLYAADSLTFDNASLTVDFQGGSSQIINLGDLDPGELLDSGGNPVVQFPSTDVFTSAVFTATLSQSSFMLSDGTTVNAASSISADLLPSSGGSLQAGVDFVTINAESPGAMPEPDTAQCLLITLAGICLLNVLVRARESRSFK